MTAAAAVAVDRDLATVLVTPVHVSVCVPGHVSVAHAAGVALEKMSEIWTAAVAAPTLAAAGAQAVLAHHVGDCPGWCPG